ncbi:hypothetical protein ABH931_007715 [Streptacidiphilus sp. MAP12-33]|uniref:DUF6213 family protein n=1 Tax=Streptacidiphilus sp. MAP12-33 TaxID=3156266 RepID=UPI0035122B0B
MSEALPMTVGVARDAEGELYVPAQQVTTLLRRLAAHWRTWGEETAALDTGTVHALVDELLEVADQLDVECIARTRPNPEGGER